MTATTDILPFATSGGANVIDQATYAGNTTLLANGFVSGIARSNIANKVWRQTSFMAAGLASWCVLQGISVPDDGNLTNLVGEIDAAMSAKIANAVSAELTGVVKMYGSSSVPTGYLECNGAAVSRTTFSSLFAVIGTAYGNGDGATTFNVPDMRGMFPRGWDHGAGVDPARSLGSTQADGFASHTHTPTVTDPSHDHVINVATSSFICSGSGANFALTSFGTRAQANTTGISVAIAATGGTETRPKNVTFMFIVKT